MGFDIEQSMDNENFTKIGFVPGFGTTSEARSYTFAIADFSSGVQYYRLKQLDFDGTFTFTNSVEIEGPAPNNFSLSQNYPNPFNPSTVVNFTLPVESSITLKVYNMLGEDVLEILNSGLQAGYHKLDIDGSALSSGSYFYVLEATGTDGSIYRSVKKMILMK